MRRTMTTKTTPPPINITFSVLENFSGQSDIINKNAISKKAGISTMAKNKTISHQDKSD